MSRLHMQPSLMYNEAIKSPPLAKCNAAEVFVSRIKHSVSKQLLVCKPRVNQVVCLE